MTRVFFAKLLQRRKKVPHEVYENPSKQDIDNNIILKSHCLGVWDLGEINYTPPPQSSSEHTWARRISCVIRSLGKGGSTLHADLLGIAEFGRAVHNHLQERTLEIFKKIRGRKGGKQKTALFIHICKCFLWNNSIQTLNKGASFFVFLCLHIITFW